MQIRKAVPADFGRIRRLAEVYNLDYAGMESDDFWVAVQGRGIAGICGLKKHPDCQELIAVAVAERFRKKGVGKQLVSRLLVASAGDIYLTTIVPDYFERLGFEPARRVPPSMVKPEEWCAGCRPDRCRVMVKRRR